MEKIYSIWVAYALYVVSAFDAYTKRTDHLPPLLAFGLLLLPVVVVNWLLPRWASLPIFAAVGLPLVWFMATFFCLFFSSGAGRVKR